MRIINIVENLDKGAVENWLVRMFLESRKLRPEWEWTFYCIHGTEGRLDNKVRMAGGKIIYSPVTISNKISFLKHLRYILKVGKFDVIHSHHDYLSGFYLLASSGIRFKKRILHIHNTDKALPVGNRVLRRFLLNPFRKLAFHYSDRVVGISHDALREFVGKRKAGKKRFRVLYYGIDVSAFEKPADRYSLRKELKLPGESRVLLFVGRMNEVKNPVFVVDILNEVLNKHNEVYAVFVGKGDAERDVIKRAEALGISSNIRMLEWRNDIAAIMKSCDVFVFPRVEYPKEGLGLVVVEAQAAGLPMVLSHGIVDDAIVVKELVHFLPLSNNPEKWAEKIVAIISDKLMITKEMAFQKVNESRFELGKATENLLSLYEN